MKKQMMKLIDNRNKEDIKESLNTLAASYTPEWRENIDNPDIASALFTVYSEQVADNIDRVNGMIDRYHTEFVNLLDISARGAKPASSIVIMNLSQDTIDGVEILAGTRLSANGDEATANGEDIIFETSYNTYITGASITRAFMVNSDKNSITPLLGDINIPQLLTPYEVELSDDDMLYAMEEEETATEEAIVYSDEPNTVLNRFQFKPFKLFGENKGIQKNAVLFYHTYLFDADNAYISVRLIGASELIKDIEEGRRQFCYATKGKLVPVEKVKKVSEDVFVLSMENKQDLQLVNGQPAHLIAIVDDGIIDKATFVDSIQFKSNSVEGMAEYIGNGVSELEGKDFTPFNDTLAIYQECYIGDNQRFSKAGSRITLSFDLTFDENRQYLSKQEEDEELKVIKRKPKDIVNTSPPEVYVQEISFEYFNGLGYMKLDCDSDIKNIFAEGRPDHCEISFICPQDWQEGNVGGFEGRLIRMMILRADNCYLRPSVHYSPRIKNLKISYKYENFMNPMFVQSVYGTVKQDITQKAMRNEKLCVFRPMGYDYDALYLGLDKKPVKGPVTIFFRLEDMTKYEPLEVIFEYSSRDGFKHLKVSDETKSMSKSGLVTFMPPTDFSEVNLEGNNLFWIRVIRNRARGNQISDINLPNIYNICMNGVQVQNIDTRPLQTFYLEEVTPYARFNLNIDGLLKTDVWVNEIDNLSDNAMNSLMITMPDRVIAETDINNKITGFFVKWTEVERFDASEDRRVYVLDRISRQIIFGDGINTDIPRTISDVALRVQPYVSNGVYGNVEAGRINTSMSAMYFIGDIYNPIKGYGGSSMESVEAAMRRGANIISSRRHLVSVKDYEREILAYSDLIDQVKAVSEYNAEGKPEYGALTFLLLMKDYKDGSYSIHQMENALKNHLLESSEITIVPSKFYITEPVFVEISVTAWLKVKDMQDSFDIQRNLVNSIDEYIDPRKSTLRNWNIGDIPSVTQILMRINSNKQDAIIENIVILAKYNDGNGSKEVHLEEMKVTPFMIGVPGRHQIHVDI